MLKQVIRLKVLTMIKPFQLTFKASDGWVRDFLWRHNLVLRPRTSIAQMLSVDLQEKIACFWQDVHYI